MSHTHVIGAGMAGLAAALTLTAAGRAVTVHEAGPAAGGRCRSYLDKELGLRIDNGNHLLLSGNDAAMSYIRETGAADRFTVPARPAFPFLDVKTREGWVLRPNRGRIPWWVLIPGRRVPRTRLLDYLRLRGLVGARGDTTVADAMRRGWLYWRLVEPLAVAALNTRPQMGLARLLGAVMRETLLRGGNACIPWLPKTGLSEALIDPAVATLTQRGATLRCNHRIAELRMEAGRIAALRGPGGPIALAPDDAVLLAVPPWVAADLVPGLQTPDAYEAILNIHFATVPEPDAPLMDVGFIGLTSGVAEWVFAKRDHVSVTISAANHMVDDEAGVIAAAVWPNVKLAMGQTLSAYHAEDDMPPWRVVKERRATFAATARQDALRPDPGRVTQAANLAVAGDWTDTGLPATIEGAIRSGRLAAEALLKS
ncbi:hydroxysqualene dehydroxylase HpnE [Rhodopila sp.]|jgi:squalene-associated FAD-dependent desaturase|uniref:hydroxysqualene dehydroxylase HpnE n=1 Tax=Rhodopila sp. TaxID=2480087 RepID=UPI002C173691|nr:hydroxysqualene dehydroxylase HpnE [Rhodopila sp.]HVZ10154.1 hydroxysqualene dehydroxylase HpnE [Rhodopila sp.]